MLADVQATAATARETIRSIVENHDDLTSPLTAARLAHADRDSLLAVNSFTVSLDGGYWLRPFSSSAGGLREWGEKFDERAPVSSDGMVWDPRLAMPTLLYALVVRVLVLKALHADPRRYCHEIRARVQFLLSLQMRWQTGLRRKHQLSVKELQFGAGFSTRPFAAGAVDVFTGASHIIDVDVQALNLSYALGYWGGPLPAHVPWLHPENVCPDITDDEIEMRFESEYRPILQKQTDFSFTKLRWGTGLHAFSDMVKSLGEICAAVSNSPRVVETYREAMRSSRERAGTWPAADAEAAQRAQFASALIRLVHVRGRLATEEARRDRFELYSALLEGRTSLASDLREVVRKHVGDPGARGGDGQ